MLLLEEPIGAALHATSSVLDGRRVRTTLPPDLPCVLCNLLANAAKYAPAGSPIEISAEATADQMRIFIDDRRPVPA